MVQLAVLLPNRTTFEILFKGLINCVTLRVFENIVSIVF